MENLFIQQTPTSPNIELNAQTHQHSIIGESYPDSMYNFYEPIMEWIESYVETLDHPAVFNFELIYFNSSTSRTLRYLFDLFDKACHNQKEIVVNWFYEDEGVAEYGEDFSEDLENLAFNIVHK